MQVLFLRFFLLVFGLLQPSVWEAATGQLLMNIHWLLPKTWWFFFSLCQLNCSIVLNFTVFFFFICFICYLLIFRASQWGRRTLEPSSASCLNTAPPPCSRLPPPSGPSASRTPTAPLPGSSRWAGRTVASVRGICPFFADGPLLRPVQYFRRNHCICESLKCICLSYVSSLLTCH